MIINYIKYLINRFVQAKIFTKVIVSLFILLEIFIIIICFVKVNKEVDTPGFLDDPLETIIIDSSNGDNSFIRTISVQSFSNVSIIQSWIANNEEQFSMADKSNIMSDDEYDDYAISLKKIAINSAIMLAYQKAALKDDSIVLSYDYLGKVIYYINDKSCDLKNDDIITAIEGTRLTYVNGVSNFSNIIDTLLGPNRDGGTKKVNDFITFSILRYDNKKGEYSSTAIERSISVKEREIKDQNNLLKKELYLGLNISDYFDLHGQSSNPKFQVDYNETWDSRGSSGGMMMTLSIYNALLSEDITHGKGIAGTGTISLNGEVGSIGAITQKTIAVGMRSVDIFFVDDIKYSPNEKTDYQIALETKQKYDFKATTIVPVKTFDDILNYLESLGE